MTEQPVQRVMWLLNHRTARAFDVGQLQALGFREIFLPKRMPKSELYSSGDVDHSLDSELTIPASELAVLNAANWYDGAGSEAWKVANRHFQIAIARASPSQIEDVTRNFSGAIVARASGLGGRSNHATLWRQKLGTGVIERIVRLGSRFWFGQAYSHLHEIEHDILQQRRCYLPLGLADATPDDRWTGEDARVFFVCPRIASNSHFASRFQKFANDFAGIPFLVGGSQPLPVLDLRVLGFLTREEYEARVRTLRVMYYDSTERYHVHYHPFEAVRLGMPLVFMGGGLLDLLGGEKLPGRARTVKEARRKIERILRGDRTLIDAIRNSQLKLLEPMRPEVCAPAWQKAFERIGNGLKQARARVPKKRKIAVLLPAVYRGGTLRGAKLVAHAIELGSRQAGEPASVVFGHLDDNEVYDSKEHFADLPAGIVRRPFKWEKIDRGTADRAMQYRRRPVALTEHEYAVPSDGINDFLDCDFWVFISDRIWTPLLPLRPYAMVVYDYLQRYMPVLGQRSDLPLLSAARDAEAVLVTTQFTRGDAMQYAGVDPKRLHQVPQLHLIPAGPGKAAAGEYFVWPTNAAPHKNHWNSINALRRYYEQLDGRLECRITGTNIDLIFNDEKSLDMRIPRVIDSSARLKSKLTYLADASDEDYFSQVAGARFLWHTSIVDNGTFAVVEAACFGVPSLSTRYPAMVEKDAYHSLALSWCDPHDPDDMARSLKRMEIEADERRKLIPPRSAIEARNLESAASVYWNTMRSCL